MRNAVSITANAFGLLHKTKTSSISRKWQRQIKEMANTKHKTQNTRNKKKTKQKLRHREIEKTEKVEIDTS